MAMVADLMADSKRWNAEKRGVAEMETTKLQDWSHLPTIEHLVPTKKDLPLYLNGQPCRACADFGAAGNMISADFAIRSRIPFELDKTCPAFELPTFGRLAKPIGRARIECVFPSEPTSVGVYNFFVFENFVYPAIMGRKFLRDTETLDKHRHRLYDRPQQIHKIPIVAFIGAEEESLKFWLNGEQLESTPDTGSEINVMSLDFALRRKFPIVKDEFSQVRFADGSLQDIIGKVTIPVSFGTGSPPSILLKLVDSSSKSQQSIPSQPYGPNGEVNYGKTASIFADFHILQGLNVDIILGEDLLATVNAFVRYSGEFSPLTTPSSLYPGLGTIGLVKRLEKKFCELKKARKLHNWTTT